MAPLDGGCISPRTWRYWLCAAIIVPIGAPLGAFLASFLHRLVYAYIVYFATTLQLVVALLIVKQTTVTATLMGSATVLVLGLFYAMVRAAGRRAPARPAECAR